MQHSLLLLAGLLFISASVIADTEEAATEEETEAMLGLLDYLLLLQSIENKQCSFALQAQLGSFGISPEQCCLFAESNGFRTSR